jgi:hypothetical protein
LLPCAITTAPATSSGSISRTAPSAQIVSDVSRYDAARTLRAV